MTTRFQEVSESGWRLLELRSESLIMRVLPDRGATITSVIERRTGTELMWRPRWGLRPPAQVDLPGSCEAVSMAHYSGGWSTLFPNAGAPSTEHGVEWPMHGEVWLAPHSWSMSGATLSCQSMLIRSPFRFRRAITLDGPVIRIEESAVNLGADDVEVVWNHHPTFGAPLLAPEAVVRSNATVVLRDIADRRVADSTVHSTPWPEHIDAGGDRRDLSEVPGLRSGESRRAFLSGFPPGARSSIENPRLGVAVSMRWDSSDFPYMWYWLEAGGRRGFPWFGAEYVLGLEPCTSYPSGGIGAVRELTGTQIVIRAGDRVDRWAELEVARL